MKGINLRSCELAALRASGEVVVTKPIRCTKAAMTPERMAAVKILSPHQPGNVYWVKEPFRVTFDEEKNQTWMHYQSDQRLVTGASIYGRTKFLSDGMYSAATMEEWMARTRVVVQDVDVQYVSGDRCFWAFKITLHMEKECSSIWDSQSRKPG